MYTGYSSLASRFQSPMWEPIWKPGNLRSLTALLISSTARVGAFMGRVPSPTNLVGLVATVAARSLLRNLETSSVSWGLA